ncbi:hypothetical protein BGZ98_003986 [Dissophora globulifera]|nr:hypothetical protein BGZ98_003986 [Dissophora globulifera]
MHRRRSTTTPPQIPATAPDAPDAPNAPAGAQDFASSPGQHSHVHSHGSRNESRLDSELILHGPSDPTVHNLMQSTRPQGPFVEPSLPPPTPPPSDLSSSSSSSSLSSSSSSSSPSFSDPSSSPLDTPLVAPTDRSQQPVSSPLSPQHRLQVLIDPSAADPSQPPQRQQSVTFATQVPPRLSLPRQISYNAAARYSSSTQVAVAAEGTTAAQALPTLTTTPPAIAIHTASARNHANSDIDIRNAVASGLISSPTALIPPSGYLPRFLTTSSASSPPSPPNNNINKTITNDTLEIDNNINDKVSASNSNRSSPGLALGSKMSALTSLLATSSSTSASTSAPTPTVPTARASSADGSAQKSSSQPFFPSRKRSSSNVTRPVSRPFYSTIGSMSGDFSQPASSLSYNGKASSNMTGTVTQASAMHTDGATGGDTDTGYNPGNKDPDTYADSSNLGRSQSMGKRSKTKGIRTKLKEQLRTQRGTHERPGHGSDSDTEAAANGTNLLLPHQSMALFSLPDELTKLYDSTDGKSSRKATGPRPKLAVSLPTSLSTTPTHKSNSPSQKDATRPPPPPTRSHSSYQSRDAQFMGQFPTYALYAGFGVLRAAPMGLATGSTIPSGNSSVAPSITGVDSTGKEAMSSTTRFKEMIKRGLSSGSGTSASSSVHALGAPLMMTSLAISPSSTFSLGPQPWEISGDEQQPQQQQPRSSKFSVSRLTGRGRKKKQRKKSAMTTTTTTTDEDARSISLPSGSEEDEYEFEDDMSTILLQANPHRHHYRAFLPHLHQYSHYRHNSTMNRAHRRRSIGASVNLGPSAAYVSADDAMTGLGRHASLQQRRRSSRQLSRRALSKQAFVYPQPSQALLEARQWKTDPNVLLAELEPLPADYVNAFSAMMASHLASARLSTSTLEGNNTTNNKKHSVDHSNAVSPLVPTSVSYSNLGSISNSTGNSKDIALGIVSTTTPSAVATATAMTTTTALGPAAAATTSGAGSATFNPMYLSTGFQQLPMMASILPYPTFPTAHSSFPPIHPNSSNMTRANTTTSSLHPKSSYPPTPSTQHTTHHQQLQGYFVPPPLHPLAPPISPLTLGQPTSSSFPPAGAAAFTLYPPPPPTLRQVRSVARLPKTNKNLIDTHFLDPHSFLFKAYVASKFQGHYLFRVRGEDVEYAKLPAALEQACSQYFRHADVTYREIEAKAKDWKEERRAAKIKRENEFEEVRSALAAASTATATASEVVAMAASLGNGTHTTPPVEVGLDKSRHEQNQSQDQNYRQLWPHHEQESNVGSNHDTNNAEDSGSDQSSGEDTVKASSRGNNAYHLQVPASSSHGDEAVLEWREAIVEQVDEAMNEPLVVLSQSLDSATPKASGDMAVFPNRDHRALSEGDIDSSNQQVSPSQIQHQHSHHQNVQHHHHQHLVHQHQNRHHPHPIPGHLQRSQTTGVHQKKLTTTLLKDASQRRRRRRHSSFGFQIQDHDQMEQLLRGIDDAYWRNVERKHYEESRRMLYGLQVYLLELARTVEYERFDKIKKVVIQNDSRDKPLFSILNGDKTNAMCLESPSVKQKREFLNWIAIGLMGDEDNEDKDDDQGEEDRERKVPEKRWLSPQPLSGIMQLDALDLGASSRHRDLHGHPVAHNQPVDYMLDLGDLRITQLGERMIKKREETAETMRQLDETLEKLENLDALTKNLAGGIARALDTHELRSALQPSPATGLTLAQTVESKVKDVNERIVVCARIMAAARLNLNRLRYELELEQRSVKLFRQYKIAIAVVSLSILALFWLLYHRRRMASSFAAELPLLTTRWTSSQPFQEFGSKALEITEVTGVTGVIGATGAGAGAGVGEGAGQGPGVGGPQYRERHPRPSYESLHDYGQPHDGLQRPHSTVFFTKYDPLEVFNHYSQHTAMYPMSPAFPASLPPPPPSMQESSEDLDDETIDAMPA